MSTQDDMTSWEKLEELDKLLAETEEKSDDAEETLVMEGDMSELADAIAQAEAEENDAESPEVKQDELGDEEAKGLTDEAVPEANGDTSPDGTPDASEIEEKDDESDVDAKAAEFLSILTGTDEEEVAEVIEMKEADLDVLLTSGEYIVPEAYETLDDDAKAEFAEIVVATEVNDSATYFQRKDVLAELDTADVEEEDAKADDMGKEMDEAGEDMFDNPQQASDRAQKLGCSGTHRAGEKWMPCSSHDEYMRLAQSEEREMEGVEEDEMGKSADAFLCGYSRKSVDQACAFCQGGCAPEGDLPGLADVENAVKSAYSAEVLGSGYSPDDDIFVVDLKREDGSCIEVFVSGEGEELGWLRLDESALEGKSAEEIDIISQTDAEKAAYSAYQEIDPEVKGEVMSVTVDVFANQDVYVVELDGETKSFDFYVSVDGKVLGYDEWDLIDDFHYEMSEDEEIKALEAELNIKRMYSREQRESMAESGEAMEDGSFPIADEADLRNAILAVGRAADQEAAKKHIMKRAEELGLESMIPANWGMTEGEEKVLTDDGFLESLVEFERMIVDDIS